MPAPHRGSHGDGWDGRSDRARITAVLGPTNTGKTYLAIERMLGYRSGMIGFPLRLLARENYDRVVKLKGARQAALVTGEEKIVPPSARYFFCTVESMPVDRPVAFLAVDEIQLCADAERGHVFTDRLLNARGEDETMFLGAETIKPVLRRLVPEADFITRPRFSSLSYSGQRKITRLPPRSAVVAFSAARVYELAELLRRQRGGTAVVLGALSPRTRNAQVEMFESGEVDYLVATDAIGMGLNLNLDHVAFSQLAKFDGRGPRHLTASEAGQIAGRAGRHMNDGTFGTTGDLGAMDEELVGRVEEHRFEALKALSWRNSDLDLRSPEALRRSLERRPPVPELVLAREAEDAQALAALSRDPDVRPLAESRDAVALLWEVCRVPDFEKILTDQHARLLSRIYRFLMAPDGRLPDDWVARQIGRVERTAGDIDALMARIQQVRTWTYITHRGDWLSDAAHWQERTRAIEDRLSDALHDRLTQRFVDRRTAVLVRRLKGGDKLIGAVRRNGEVVVEGEFVGRLEGFRFTPDVEVHQDDHRALMAAARRALAGEIPGRVRELEAEEDRAFSLDSEGRIVWREQPIARLAAGASPLQPRVVVRTSEFLDGRQRERLRKRLALWLERHLRGRLHPLFRLAEADLGARAASGPEAAGALRGLVFQLVEAMGVLPRRALAAQLSRLGKPERRLLSELGVRIGAGSLYLPELMRPRGGRLRVLLWATAEERQVPLLPVGPLLIERGSAEGEALLPEAFWQAAGYRLLRRKALGVAMRADALERLGRQARTLAAEGPFAATPELLALAGDDAEALALLLGALGYRRQGEGDEVRFAPKREPTARRRKTAKAKRGGEKKTATPAAEGEAAARKSRKKRARGSRRDNPDSPFASLRGLKLRR